MISGELAAEERAYNRTEPATTGPLVFTVCITDLPHKKLEFGSFSVYKVLRMRTMGIVRDHPAGVDRSVIHAKLSHSAG